MKFVAIFLVTVLLPASNLLLAAESADISALRALDQSYATKWIEGDADGVMALFTEDATLVPHHGDDPIRNRSTSSKNLLEHCYLESCHCAVRSSPFSTLTPPPNRDSVINQHKYLEPPIYCTYNYVLSNLRR